MAVDFLVPKLIFISKFGISFAYLTTYQVSFNDQKMFPSDVRATAIG
jgi:hypothetical protein